MQRISRRGFVKGGVAAVAASAIAPVAARADRHGGQSIALTARPAKIALPGVVAGAASVWSYNGAVPGPLLKVAQGERLSVRLANALPEPTSIHWHGQRVPNDQDGVPFVTQKPVASGATHQYSFVAKDAGTFLYHPHINSVAQVGRGLFGALIVTEPKPVPVDRDVLWAVNDWVATYGVLDEDFSNFHDRSHAGRYGNRVSVNGRVGPALAGQPNERIRLRLLNAATGRILALKLEGLKPWLVALDGQPVAPRPATAADLLIGPGMRADLVVDLPDARGKRFRLVDVYDDRAPYTVGEIVVGDGKPVRAKTLGAPAAMAANPLPVPDLARAERREVVFGGGAMGGMMGMGPMNMMSMARRGLFWAINGRFDPKPDGRRTVEPMLALKHGRSYVLALENRTAFDHPIHLHGHTFRIVSRDGRRLADGPWRDSVMLRPNGRVEIAFVADNPGDWMFHCHILSHQVSGMMGVVRVG
jgi:FtsP/CotA-like multicopper oxidase with cupredoxin domain